VEIKKVTGLFLIAFISFAFIPNKRIAGKWKLHSIKEIKSGITDSTFKNEKGLNIQFSVDTVLGGKLTINSFGGYYRIDKNKIKINIGAVTEVCCDTKSAERFLDNLQASQRFFVNGDTLTLTGPAKVMRLVKIR
jgi:heat shock protein HslJ